MQPLAARPDAHRPLHRKRESSRDGMNGYGPVEAARIAQQLPIDAWRPGRRQREALSKVCITRRTVSPHEQDEERKAEL